MYISLIFVLTINLSKFFSVSKFFNVVLMLNVVLIFVKFNLIYVKDIRTLL